MSLKTPPVRGPKCVRGFVTDSAAAVPSSAQADDVALYPTFGVSLET